LAPEYAHSYFLCSETPMKMTLSNKCDRLIFQVLAQLMAHNQLRFMELAENFFK
jgi:hypothetical protein